MTPFLARLEEANRLADLGRGGEAEALLESLGGFAPAQANLALLKEARHDLLGAIFHHREACRLLPTHPQVWFNAANTLEHARHYCESEAAWRQALALKPDWAEAWNNLGSCLQEQGRVLEADAAFRRAIALKPDFLAAHSSFLINLHYLPQATPEAIHEATLAVGRLYARPLTPAAPRKPKDKLRIGLLCAYVRRHPLGSLVVAGLAKLDPERFPLFAYVNESSQDTSAARLRANCREWRDIGPLSDEQAAKSIQADGIDILIDLAGHTRGHRMGVLALKPAPLQIFWASAYWNGLGLEAVERVITDRVECPPDAPVPLLERPLYLQDSFACFDPPDDAPPVSPAPILTRKTPSFASFNRLAKLNDEVLALWGRVLAASPAARLVVQAHAFDDVGVRQNFIVRMKAVGVAEDRLHLLGALSHHDVLKAYGEADVFLDSFPWAGSIIAMESLFMGVPVIALPHPSISGRHAASLLSTLGEPDWIAKNPDDYVAKALELVSDPLRLADIRANLRQRFLVSPLCDAKRFAAGLECLLQNAWLGRA